MDISGLAFGSDDEVPCSAGMPSITYNGSLFALIEPVPRTRTRKPAPGIPEFEVTCTPAALAWRPVVRVTMGAAPALNSFAESDDTAPVRSCFSTVAYPMATTGLSSIALCCSAISTTACWPSCTVTLASAGTYPTSRARTR